MTNDIHDKLSLIDRYAYATLTKRELECCQWLIFGYSNSRIAKKLNISARTVEHYINSLKIKLRCTSKRSLTEYLRQKLNHQGKYPT